MGTLIRACRKTEGEKAVEDAALHFVDGLIGEGNCQDLTEFYRMAGIQNDFQVLLNQGGSLA